MTLCGGEGLKRGQCCCWLTSGGLPGPHPVSSHFTHFPYAIGAPLAVVLVVVPRVGGFSLFPALQRSRQFLRSPQNPTGFTARKYETFFSWRWSPRLCGLAWGWASFLTRCLLDFYPTLVNVGLPWPCCLLASLPPHLGTSLPLLATATPSPLCPNSQSPSLLRTWLNTASLNPWLSEFCTVLGDFLAVLGVFNF